MVLVLAGLSVGLASADSWIEKKYPDGTPKLKYRIRDDNGDKEGSYEEFHPSGKIKVKAVCNKDKFDGPYRSFHPNGKPFITANYKDGQLEGNYSEDTEQGEKKLIAVYKEGKLNGTLTRFENGKPVLTQLYRDGAPAYPRSLADIQKALAEIGSSKGIGNPDLDAGIRRLRMYRYLAEVPYQDVVLDPDLNKYALAAAGICEKLGRLDHNPPNPGLPDDQYKLAQTGAKNSNLAGASKALKLRLDFCVDLWMNDSDPSNIDRLGHRRWCINPTMAKTGMGSTGRFAAMWSTDCSAKNVPDFDYIAYPPRGLLPVEFFGPNHAWNVSPNPRKYKPATDAVQVKIFNVDPTFKKAGDALKLNYTKVSNVSIGIPSCIIFRPEPGAVAPGRRYLVEIDGLVAVTGAPASIRYFVEFTSLR
jgi:hypothetical protein